MGPFALLNAYAELMDIWGGGEGGSFASSQSINRIFVLLYPTQQLRN